MWFSWLVLSWISVTGCQVKRLRNHQVFACLVTLKSLEHPAGHGWTSSKHRKEAQEFWKKSGALDTWGSWTMLNPTHMKTSASWCGSHSAAIRYSYWFILFRLRCRRSPSLTNWCKYKGTDLRSLSVMVMHELQTEVQSECMTSTLERSKSKNGSLIPFVSALVLKSACPEYCAHHRYPRMFSLALRMAATSRTWSIFFSGPCGWKLSYCYSRDFGWNMEFPRHSHLCVCAWLSTPSCEGMYAASQGPNNLSNTCVILCRYLTAYNMTSVTWGIWKT